MGDEDADEMEWDEDAKAEGEGEGEGVGWDNGKGVAGWEGGEWGEGRTRACS